MPQILRVKRTGDFQEGSARARWYKRLVDFNGRPVETFIASVEDAPPSTPETGPLKGKLEPVAGWLRFFRNEGLLEIEATGMAESTTVSILRLGEHIEVHRSDVVKALEDLDAGISHRFSEATGYELHFAGKKYWPKAVFGVTLSRIVGKDVFPSDFKGGEGSKCFRVLGELGFDIQAKVSTAGRNDWSEKEVRQVVSEYFEMWNKEQAGQLFNKTEHRSRLIENGLKRSKGSIEFKHQNISAVLVEEGLPYIAGYRPASNYQQLLGDIVREHISTEGAGLETVLEKGDLGIDAKPGTIDFSCWLVPPPQPAGDQKTKRVTRRVSKIDYSAREDGNRKLGRSGEQVVLEYEQWRLERAGRKDLSKRIRWVAELDGDGLGYDIRSFDEDGADIFIEVKTTRSGIEMPFLISANEVAVSSEFGRRYRIYRVFNFPKDPQVYVQPGRLIDCFDLNPRLFEARPKATK